MVTLRFISILLIFALFSSIALVNCSDNPTGMVGQQEIPDVTGLIIRKNGIDIFEIQEGFIVYGEKIILKMGQNSDEYSVEFLDEGGNTVEIPNNPYELCVAIEGEQCACVESNGDWTFYLHGMSQGEAKMCIRLFKGEESDYPEYQAPKIPVAVK